MSMPPLDHTHFFILGLQHSMEVRVKHLLVLLQSFATIHYGLHMATGPFLFATGCIEEA